jgi:hypothetical protein
LRTFDCQVTIENLVECSIPAIAVSPIFCPDEWHLVNNKKISADTKLISNFKEDLKKHTKVLLGAANEKNL